MKFRIEDPNLFIKIVSSIKKIADNTDFTISPESIIIQTIDLSGTCMFDIKLNNNFYSDIKDDIIVGVNIKNLENVLSLSSKNQELFLSVSNNEFVLDLMTNGKSVINFCLNNVEPNGTKFDMNVRTGLYTDEYELIIDYSEFKKNVKDLSKFGEICTIDVLPDSASLSVKGDAGSGRIEFSESIQINKLGPNENCNRQYKFKYLSIFASCDLSDKICLKFSSDGLLCCEYLLKDYGYARYYVGPHAEVDN